MNTLEQAVTDITPEAAAPVNEMSETSVEMAPAATAPETPADTHTDIGRAEVLLPLLKLRSIPKSVGWK